MRTSTAREKIFLNVARFYSSRIQKDINYNRARNDNVGTKGLVMDLSSSVYAGVTGQGD
jgi:hypothetical protein